ncbi:MAG TPA: hypothetical protein VD931_19395, partial [Baekduia sp.]|nr:hypothetical protein [Baekduia sp.]
MRRLPALLVLLLLAVPGAAHADLTSMGSGDVRVRNGVAVVDDGEGAWRVWDLRAGRIGPRHEGFCGPSRLLDWGRDIGLRGAAFVAVSLDVVETPAVGPPPAGDDPLCRTARAVLDRDGDGRSEPGVFAVLRAADLGRTATALPLLRLGPGQAPSSLAVRGSDIWVGIQGGASYLELERGASAWSAPRPATLRDPGVEPDPLSDTQLLDGGALWRWTWSDATRRGRLRITAAGRPRV